MRRVAAWTRLTGRMASTPNLQLPTSKELPTPNLQTLQPGPTRFGGWRFGVRWELEVGSWESSRPTLVLGDRFVEVQEHVGGERPGRGIGGRLPRRRRRRHL